MTYTDFMHTIAEGSFFGSGFVPHDLDALPWPATICDREGTVLFKNQYAYRLKLFRIRSKVEKIISQPQRNDFALCLANLDIKLFECENGSGFSYALTFPLQDGTIAISWIIGTILLNSVMQKKGIDAEYEHYKNIERLIQLYLATCRKLKDADDPAAMEVLLNNSLRFCRTVRYFGLYARTLVKTDKTEHPVLCPVSDICQELSEYFGKHISSLGYRLNFSSESPMGTSMLPKQTFVCVFLQMATLSLRMASDYHVQIHLRESENRLKLEYTFRAADSFGLTLAACSIELEFLHKVCEDNGWEYFPPSRTGEDGVFFSFSVPIVEKKDVQVQAAADTVSDELRSLAEEEASVLFFW